jgi:hypothetical protein
MGIENIKCYNKGRKGTENVSGFSFTKAEGFGMAGERASEKKSNASKELLERVFSQKTQGRRNFKLVYAYSVKRKLLSAKVSDYVLAFKPEKKEIILIQIDSEGNTLSDRIQIDEMDITHAEATDRGGWMIDSKQLKSPAEFFVPENMPDSAEITYQLPINQEELAAEFRAMMKEICD